jgi:ribose transport system substrate-binding protein
MQKEDGMRKLKLILVVLVSVAMLAACAAPTAAPTAAPATSATTAPAAAGPQEIAVIVKTGNSGYWQNVQTGAMTAQKELSALTPMLSVTFLGPQSESMITEEINMVQWEIDRGV